ncbi:pitrilysin family protein [Prochlorococcus sp. MIT 1300]|uniref:M16 family metallopeptidase n=1 Tax=Prochlorococcus sp. MIT 1300 TaxID=3096218 RepID=UPI002A757818|nr:pitrilysin family protein [Prochlorococcus sp. MIT 1300]
MDLFQKPLARSIQGPNLQEWSLSNGTTCVLASMPDAPLTCLDLWCKAGSAKELPGEEGLAHFLEHMVFKGSQNLAAGEFDFAIEALGGSSNAATGFDDVHFYVLVPPDGAVKALELLLNLVLKPQLNENAYSIEREVVLEEIAQYRDQPDEQVIQKLLQSCWPNHPYGRAILGQRESLIKSNPKQMRSFHQNHYVGPNICLSIAGSIPHNIKELISNSPLSTLSSQKEDNADQKNPRNLTFRKGRQEIFIPRLESSRLLIAWPMPAANNQEMIMGADIATSLLAEGRRSRLVQHLREDLQIVESIDMDITVLEQGSLVVLEACLMENHLEELEKEITLILKKALESSLEEKELLRATQLVRNGLCFNLEAPSQVAAISGNQSLWNRHQALLEPLKQINEWSGEALQKRIFPLLQPEMGFILIARPTKEKP